MRKLLLDVAPFRVCPPVAGAHHAVYYANEALSGYWDIFLFTTGFRRDTIRFLPRSEEIVINTHFREYSFATTSIIPFSFLTRQGSGVPQIYASKYLSWEKPRILSMKMRECDIIQVEAPWQVEYVCKINRGVKPLVFIAHNVEGTLWERINSNGNRSYYKSWIIDEMGRQERDAFHKADAVIAVSDVDRERIIELYGVKDEKVFCIPWGVDTEKYRIHSEEDKIEAKRGLDLSNKRVVVFSGALYGPNIEAVRSILDMASQMDDNVVFLIVGRVGEAFKGVSHRNVLFTGFVEDPVKYFTAADVAINSMSSGGGMHLKMLEYLASGLPVVTTEVGARGLRKPWKDYLLVSDLKGFPEGVRSLLHDQGAREYFSKRGREVVEEFYTWDKVARERMKVYEMLLKGEKGPVSLASRGATHGRHA